MKVIKQNVFSINLGGNKKLHCLVFHSSIKKLKAIQMECIVAENPRKATNGLKWICIYKSCRFQTCEGLKVIPVE